MNSKKIFFLAFLENIAPVAAQNAKKMEELMFEDASSSIIKARVFIEEIINEVFIYEKIEAPYQSTLYDKIIYLTGEGYIKREIQQAFDTIRYSGNKAAHSGDFNDIAEAFRLHKEMYKIGVWFYEVYSIDQLKIPPYEIPKPRPKDNIEEIIKNQILEILGPGSFESVQKKEENKFNSVQKEHENGETSYLDILNKDLDPGQSYLLRELGRLKDSSQEAIENANQFSSFKDYLHVDRKIQKDLEDVLELNKNRDRGNLILLCGSVGDGKSHLLAYLKNKKPDLLKDYTIFNDATESFSPNKNAMETLEEILNSFSDENIHHSKEKVVLAINMGVLHNFINTKHKEYSYNNLKQFVEQSDLFSQSITTYYSNEHFDLLSFGDYHSYELTDNGAKSLFYSSLLNRILSQSEENPFYLALKEDEKNQIHTMAHENYNFLQSKFVQKQIVHLIIQTIVKKKLVISARAFLNFIADILIPENLQNKKIMNDFEVLESSTPNLLFNRRERSTILHALSVVDPIHRRSVFIDQLVIALNTLNDWKGIIEKNIEGESPKNWLYPFVSKTDLSGDSFNIFFESLIRITYLTNQKFAINIDEQSYSKFLRNLYYFNTGDKKYIKNFYDEIKTAIFKWKGSPKKEYIYLNKPTDKFRLSQKVLLNPTIEHLKPSTKEELDSFKSSILLAYHGDNSEKKIFLDIDYPLYALLTKVQDGYRPNKKDEEDAIKFVEFIEKLMSYGEKKKEMLVHFPNDNKHYSVKRDAFGSFVFERE